MWDPLKEGVAGEKMQKLGPDLGCQLWGMQWPGSTLACSLPAKLPALPLPHQVPGVELGQVAQSGSGGRWWGHPLGLREPSGGRAGPLAPSVPG